MSAFLGKIHYWLYDKVKLQEKLIENVIELAEEKGYKSEDMLRVSYSRYGFPAAGLLENQIDETNIHGWLQEKIKSVESRLAYVVTELLQNKVITEGEVADVFYKNAVGTMKELDISKSSPHDFFNLIFDYIIEGMPCDNVNRITENSETKITWETTKNLHKDYWEEVGGDSSNFNNFRDSWINGFLSESGMGYKYTRTEKGINTISKV